MDPSYIGQPMSAPTKQPARGAGLSGRLILVVIGLLVAVFAGIGLLIANQDNTGALSQRLTLRLEALEDILKDGKKNATSDKMKKLTGELSILLTGDKATIEAALPATKTKKSDTLTEAESSKPSIERLKNAKINANYDTAYASELTAKLEATSALIRELHSETKSKALKEALDTTLQHLTQVQKELATT